jgi:repressor LexA
MSKTSLPVKTRRGGRRATADLTPGQCRTLTAIQDLKLRRGFPPTMRELANELGISIPGAYHQVLRLVRKGFLHRERYRARAITIIRQPKERASDLVSIPLVGTVTTGKPVLATENRIGEVWVERGLGLSESCFAMNITDDSMVGAGLVPGSLVVLHQQPLAESGAIVLVLVNGESMIRRLSNRDGQIELHPENQSYGATPVGSATHFQILGKVVAVAPRQVAHVAH